MATPKRISQATFEEAVRENMEEFGMARPEAVADAVAQFTASGVDLSNIIVSGDEEEETIEGGSGDGAAGGNGGGAKVHPVILAIRQLERLNDGGCRVGSVLQAALANLAKECSAAPPANPVNAPTATPSLAPNNRAIAGSNGGVDALCTTLRTVGRALEEGGYTDTQGIATLAAAADALRTVCTGSDENRGRVLSDVIELLGRGIVTGAAVDTPAEEEGQGEDDERSRALVQMQR